MSTVAFTLTDPSDVTVVRRMHTALYMTGVAGPLTVLTLDQTYHAGDVLTLSGVVEQITGVVPGLHFATDNAESFPDVTSTGSFSNGITLTADASEIHIGGVTGTVATIDQLQVLAN